MKKYIFDLITKNIIPWTQPNEIFKKTLKSRIGLITKPILIKLKKTSEENDSKKEFETLSVRNRIKLIHDTIFSFLIKNKFIPDAERRFANDTLAKNNIIIKLSVYDSISIDEFYYHPVKDLKYMYKNKSFIRVFCSIKNISKYRIEKALQLYDPISEKVYKSDNTTVMILDSIDSIFKLNQKLLQIKFE